MTKHLMVQASFWNSYPGRTPGERGLSDSSEFRFLDSGGRIARFSRLTRTCDHNTDSAYGKMVASTGFRRWFWARVHDFYDWLTDHYLSEATSLTIARLRRSPIPSEFTTVNTAGVRYEVTQPHEARELADDLAAGTNILFSVTE